MLTRNDILQKIQAAVQALSLDASPETMAKIAVEYPEPHMGDFSSNAAMILSKSAKMNPKELAQKIADRMEKDDFSAVEVAGPGFINFKLKDEKVAEILKVYAAGQINVSGEPGVEIKDSGKILLEYFQPNIAKPLHIGHLRTAIIGDYIRRALEFTGQKVESDTHMGDWGTQFGLLILAYKRYGHHDEVAKDPITKLNEYYVKINADLEEDPSFREVGKNEFVKLEQGDPDNRAIWKEFVDWSMEKFLKINDLMDILPFDHHWPESFYEDKMPAVVEKLKAKNLLKLSQGAQIVDLEKEGLGVAVAIKSDGATTYLLRDLATFIYRKSQGFKKQIYVVDNRQRHAFNQLFAILEKMGEMQPGEGVLVDFGFMSFEGQALSTRKGNMVLAEDVIRQAEEKVAKVINDKNPDLANKEAVIKAVSKGALKYFDLSHNRHSDIDFIWDEALDFNGNSGPYLQYTHARLSSILRKEKAGELSGRAPEMTATERQLILELNRFNEAVGDSLVEFLPNVLANYMYRLATIANKFYHESPVLKEEDQAKRAFRLVLISKAKQVLGQGLSLMGIVPLEEM